jgi:hypothetical protein
VPQSSYTRQTDPGSTTSTHEATTKYHRQAIVIFRRITGRLPVTLIVQGGTYKWDRRERFVCRIKLSFLMQALRRVSSAVNRRCSIN